MADVSSKQLEEAIVLMKQILEQQKELTLERQRMIDAFTKTNPDRETERADFFKKAQEREKELKEMTERRNHHWKEEREYREQVLNLLRQLVEATKK